MSVKKYKESSEELKRLKDKPKNENVAKLVSETLELIMDEATLDCYAEVLKDEPSEDLGKRINAHLQRGIKLNLDAIDWIKADMKHNRAKR